MKRFSDFARNDKNLEGEKIDFREIFGKTIVLIAYRVMQSKFKQDRECAQLQFELDGDRRVAFTTSAVIISQLRSYEHELPFETVIKREGKYFTFS